MKKNHIYYIQRLVTNAFKKEVTQTTSEDEWIELEHTVPRLGKFRKSEPESTKEMKEKQSTRTRIIQTQGPSGTKLMLLTNLPNEQTTEEIVTLYLKRWKIETTYHTLKNKMKIESINGKASIYVDQDLWAQVYVYNMIQDVLHAGNKELPTKGQRKTYQYKMRINENIAIGLFKDQMLLIWLEKSERKRKMRLRKLQQSMEQYLLPIRQTLSSERTKNPVTSMAII